jgi:hypothetical protein
LDIKAGVTLALLHSLIGQYSPSDVQSIWARLIEEVQSANQNAGTITVASIPKDLSSAFKMRRVETIPDEFAIPRAPEPTRAWSDQSKAIALAIATLLGKWNERSEPDLDIIRRLIDGF